METTYFRNNKETSPVLAICYDFDKTLTPNDMQAQGYLQALGYKKADDFWIKSNSMAMENDMDQNLSYMFNMYKEAEGKELFTKKRLMDYGEKVSFFPGVETWFQRIDDFGKEHGIKVEHYIISSGLKEMIEGTSIAKKNSFKKIYANSFLYNEKGVAIWPAQVVNYTNKTQFLFRIEKGILDVNDCGVNDFISPDDLRIPFRNIVYIGDSDTDIPCMKLVNTYGGHSIGVFNSETGEKTTVYKMLNDNRIKYYAAADYTAGSTLDGLIKDIIERTALNEKLEQFNFKCRNEIHEDSGKRDSQAQRKKELISSLQNSGNFMRTHSIVAELQKYGKWSPEEIESLCKIGIDNSQVHYLLNDEDVKKFYMKLLGNRENLSGYASEIMNIIHKESVSLDIDKK